MPSFQLETLDEQGRPVSTRINDARMVQERVDTLMHAQDERKRKNALVKRLVDGGAPFSQAQINREGTVYRSNFNSHTPEAFLKVGETLFYNLSHEVPSLVSAEVLVGDPKAGEWARIIEEEFDNVLQKEPVLDALFDNTIHDMVLFGAGPVAWDTPRDWLPKSKNFRQFILPDRSRSDFRDWNELLIVEEYTTDELWRFIRNEEAATRAGWDVAAIKKLIVHFQHGELSHITTWEEKWEETQQQLRNNDLLFGAKHPRIPVGRYYYKELDGKISLRWVCVDSITEPEFLYSRLKEYTGWEQVCNPFMLDRGDGTYHSVRGIGVRMYGLLLQSERLNNAMVDFGYAASSIHARSQSNERRTTASIAVLGPWTIWPQDLEPQTFNFSNALQQGVSVRKELDILLSSNLAQFRPQLTQPTGNPRTAFEVAVNAQLQGVIQRAGINRWYDQLDNLYAEIWRRLMKISGEPAKTLKERLQQRGVPPQAAGAARITSTRAAGAESMIQRQANLSQTIAEIGSSLPEEGRVNLINDSIAARFGWSNVKRYNPQQEDSSLDQERSLAMGENADLRQGAPVNFSPNQNHLVHLDIHLTGMTEAANVQDPNAAADVGAFLLAAGEHSQLHLQSVAGDPLRSGIAEQVGPQIDELMKFGEQLIQSAEQFAEAEAIQQGGDPKIAIEAAKTQQKMSLEQIEQAQKLSQRDEVHQQKVRQKEEAHAQQLAQQREVGVQSN